MHKILAIQRELYPCKLLPFAVFHFNQMSGFFRSVPSPEQGTSQSTRSNLSVVSEPSAKAKCKHAFSYLHSKIPKT
jgi:hypothetical protein